MANRAERGDKSWLTGGTTSTSCGASTAGSRRLTTAVPLQGINGMLLMERLTGSYVHDRQQARGFIQELHIASDLGLLTFDVAPGPANVVPASADPSVYVQAISNFALTVTGQDRARGRVVAQPPPDPADDDGRMLSDMILRQIAGAVTAQYAPDEVAEFLAEEGIPPAQLILPDEIAEGDAHAVLAALWRWGSEGRRSVRRFIGRWLDDRLLSGPDAELRARLIEQLARQGWQVRESDSVLVIGDPVRGIPSARRSCAPPGCTPSSRPRPGTSSSSISRSRACSHRCGRSRSGSASSPGSATRSSAPT